MLTESARQEEQVSMRQPELGWTGQLLKRRLQMQGEPWADLPVRKSMQPEGRRAYLLDHTDNETLLLDLVGLDSVGILQDLA